MKKRNRRIVNKAMETYKLNSYMFEFQPNTRYEYSQAEKAYFKILKAYCKYLKINYKSIIRFLLGLTDQNWDRLHETDEENNSKTEQLFNNFKYEFAYVYDRFSYSRMLRLHYQWLVFSKRLFKDIMKEQNIDPLCDRHYDYYDYLEEYHQKFRN